MAPPRPREGCTVAFVVSWAFHPAAVVAPSVGVGPARGRNFRDYSSVLLLLRLRRQGGSPFPRLIAAYPGCTQEKVGMEKRSKGERSVKSQNTDEITQI